VRPDQNELWERYEDAMFTLLMDEVAHQEGQEQLEWKKQLNDDPSAALPEEVRKKGEQTIRKAFAAQSRRSARHVGFRIFQRIAVAVMLVLLTAVCAFAAFPEIRTGILNMIADVYEDHTDFSFTTNASKSDPASAYNVELAWIPDGFEVSEEGSHYSTAWKTYENGNGAILYIAESSVDNRTMTVDTEDAEVNQVTIQGYEGTMVQKSADEWTCIIFTVPEKNMVVYIDSEFIEAEETLKVAENIIIR